MGKGITQKPWHQIYHHHSVSPHQAYFNLFSLGETEIKDIIKEGPWKIMAANQFCVLILALFFG